MKKPKILITGASGFCGQHLVKYFHERSYPVFTHKGKKQGDLAHSPNMRPQAFDVIIHTAGISPGENVSKALLFENLRIAQSIIWYSKLSNSKRIIFFSSVSVYGEPLGLVSENTVPRYPEFYGKVKQLCEELFEENDVPVDILRLPAIVGSGAHSNWPARLRQEAEQTGAITSYNTTKRYNTVVHIDYVCQLCEKLITLDRSKQSSFNDRDSKILVGSSEPLTILQAVEILAPNVRHVALTTPYKPPSILVLRKLERYLPPWTVEDTLHKYMETTL